MIVVRDLRKSFGSVQAVQGVSFQAADGTITGLLGPNGAGKTTTLRVLYGLLKPDGGTATVDGVDVARDPVAAQRRIGALPDIRGLYPRLTSRENIRYFGRLHGLGGEPLEKRIDELIGLLDMGDIADRRADGFSAGERLKVAIARALVHQPQNVLLDEPTSGLDVMTTRSMRDVIRRLRDTGACVLFSSHIMQEVAALCEHIVVVARGRVAADGSPADLLNATRQATLEDAFVAAVGTEEGLVR